MSLSITYAFCCNELDPAMVVIRTFAVLMYAHRHWFDTYWCYWGKF